MSDIDIFNGDADGICSLIQLRLSDPRRASLVTGVKRDIALVDRAKANKEDRITILDISYDRNRLAVERAINAGAKIFYCDHHFSGDLLIHHNLKILINTSPEVCTSVLINGYLGSHYAEWAMVGAFGDNLIETAYRIAKPLSYKKNQLDILKKLGTYINYNSYGIDIDDLNCHPAEVYRTLVAFKSPFDFIYQHPGYFDKLESSYYADVEKALVIPPEYEDSSSAVFFLPNQSWARRVIGVFSNQLANDSPSRAHAVLIQKNEGEYMVSVRAPLKNRKGADLICRQFPTGGGRAAAAGIDNLPADQVKEFIKQFSALYS